jgi:hypothetical protein
LRSTGSATRCLTASRSAREPLNFRCSVSTEIAEAPPSRTATPGGPGRGWPRGRRATGSRA